MRHEVLKGLRMERGFSQKELAEKLGVSSSMISRYEAGDRNPSMKTLEKMSTIFKVEVSYLCGSDLSLEASLEALTRLVSNTNDLQLTTSVLVVAKQLVAVCEAKRVLLTYELREA